MRKPTNSYFKQEQEKNPTTTTEKPDERRRKVSDRRSLLSSEDSKPRQKPVAKGIVITSTADAEPSERRPGEMPGLLSINHVATRNQRRQVVQILHSFCGTVGQRFHHQVLHHDYRLRRPASSRSYCAETFTQRSPAHKFTGTPLREGVLPSLPSCSGFCKKTSRSRTGGKINRYLTYWLPAMAEQEQGLKFLFTETSSTSYSVRIES